MEPLFARPRTTEPYSAYLSFRDYRHWVPMEPLFAHRFLWLPALGSDGTALRPSANMERGYTTRLQIYTLAAQPTFL